jgi:hypothetical protein
MFDGEATGTNAGAGAAAGEPTVRRDDVVELFGTPDQTTGSVNEPRLQVEHGIRFNEKWVYDRPRREPTRPRARVVYWQRYDFVGCVRIEPDGRAVAESPSELLARRRAPGH